MVTSLVIQERLEYVFTCIHHGMTIFAIAQHLGISTRQVDRYLKRIRKQYAKKEQREEGWMRIVDYSEGARLRIRKLWQIVNDSASEIRDVLTALSLLRKEGDLAIKIDLITGVLPREGGLPRIIVEDRATKKQRIDIRKQLMLLAEEEEKVKQEMEKRRINESLS